MKHISFFSAGIILLVLISCSSSKNFPGEKQPAGQDWFIATLTYSKLRNKYNKDSVSGKLKMPDKFEANQAQLNYIYSTFPGATIDTVLVEYRRADQKKYRQLWGTTHKACKVHGYVTKIWKITFTQASDTVPGFKRKYYLVDGDPEITMYSVGYKICPPPYPCN